MKRFKNALFLATVATSALASSFAQAQTTANNNGETALHGTGATSIQGVLVQELNCNGGYSNLGAIGTSSVAGTSSTSVEPTNLFTGINCATTDLWPGFVGRYIGSGSGTGRSSWIAAGSLTSTSAFAIGTANPNPFGTWSKVQFAFADSSVTDGDLTSYTSGAAQTNGGAPIMFPKFVLPVAVAYSPNYGTKTVGGVVTSYNFAVANPQAILGNNAGGLRLSQSTLCGVFNGTIVNFNNAAFTADNGGTSLRDSADATARWNADGVPVRLVGRLDRSGTTDIFTRALAAQCGSVASGNKYATNAETLPYNRTVTATVRPVFDSVRADTGLQTASTQPEAGNTSPNDTSVPGTPNFSGATVVGAEYWSGSAIVTPAANAGKPSSQPSGANGSGRFLVADGSGRVASAIKFAPDYVSPSDTTVKLNGKIGYIGADFIDGSPSAPGGLHAAALQNATTGLWHMPSAANATTAFGTVLPPQSDSAGGFDDTNADLRQVRIPTYQGGTPGVKNNAKRSNPLAWYDVMYANTGLQNPTAGYPITGTTQFLGYTCYATDASGSNATAMVNFLNFNTDYTGSVTVDSTGTNRTGIFTRVGALFANSGLLVRSNIGGLPNAWKRAVRETFLVDSNETSATRLGNSKLFMGTPAVANSTCSGKAGI